MQKNIAAEGLQAAVINMAISDHDGETQMKRVLDLPPEPLGSENDWMRGTSYVCEKERSWVPDCEKLSFEEFTVRCITLNTLIEKLDLDSIDYMQIDAEGHELCILENYDFRVCPAMIKIEHAHARANLREPEDIEKILEHHKYMTFMEERDVYGII
jgi:FkbM family methyltransferase